MHKKLFNKLLLFTAVATMSSTYTSASLYESQWHSLEDIFILQPEQEVQSLPNKLKKLTLGATVSGLSWLGGITAANSLQRNNQVGVSDLFVDRSYDHKKKQGIVLGLGLLSIIPGAIAHNQYHAYLLGQAEHNALLKVLSNWNLYKNYIPKELHQAFETMQIGKSLHDPNAIVRLVKTQVYNKFPQKYATEKERITGISIKERRNYNHNVTTDWARVIHGIADLYRSIMK